MLAHLKTPFSCALCSAANWNCANVQKIDLEDLGSNVLLTGQIHSIKRRSKWMEKLISWKNRSWVGMTRNTNIQREEKCWETHVWVWMAEDWFSLHFCQVASSAKNSATVASWTKQIGHLPPSQWMNSLKSFVLFSFARSTNKCYYKWPKKLLSVLNFTKVYYFSPLFVTLLIDRLLYDGGHRNTKWMMYVTKLGL